MKWTRPFSGACLQCTIADEVYFIAEDHLGEYHLAVKPNRKSYRKQYNTYRQMYKAIAGRTPEESCSQKAYAGRCNQLTENDIQNMVRYELTINAGAGDNLRSFCKDGQDYAVDMSNKEVWPYWLPQRISPIFNREKECRDWADVYLEEKYGQQLTISDI